MMMLRSISKYFESYRCKLCRSFWHNEEDHCDKHPDEVNHGRMLDCFYCLNDLIFEGWEAKRLEKERELNLLADKIAERIKSRINDE